MRRAALYHHFVLRDRDAAAHARPQAEARKPLTGAQASALLARDLGRTLDGFAQERRDVVGKAGVPAAAGLRRDRAVLRLTLGTGLLAMAVAGFGWRCVRLARAAPVCVCLTSGAGLLLGLLLARLLAPRLLLRGAAELRFLPPRLRGCCVLPLRGCSACRRPTGVAPRALWTLASFAAARAHDRAPGARRAGPCRSPRAAEPARVSPRWAHGAATAPAALLAGLRRSPPRSAPRRSTRPARPASSRCP